MKCSALLAGTTAIAIILGGIHTSDAAGNWWPAKYYNMDSGSAKETEYTPLQEKATKPWNICVLFPHMKDSFWVAADYGIVEEAKRQNVNVTLYEAGGYENLPRLNFRAETAVGLIRGFRCRSRRGRCAAGIEQLVDDRAYRRAGGVGLADRFQKRRRRTGPADQALCIRQHDRVVPWTLDDKW